MSPQEEKANYELYRLAHVPTPTVGLQVAQRIKSMPPITGLKLAEAMRELGNRDLPRKASLYLRDTNGDYFELTRVS